MLKRVPGIKLVLTFHLAIAWTFIPASAFAEEPDQPSAGAETANSQEPLNPKPPVRLQKIPSVRVSPPPTFRKLRGRAVWIY